MEKKSRSKNPLKVFGIVVIIVSVIACFASIISTQASLVEKRRELDELNLKIEEINNENREYQDLFKVNKIDSYKEKMAIENMNYAYPNEIRFYDTSRN